MRHAKHIAPTRPAIGASTRADLVEPVAALVLGLSSIHTRPHASRRSSASFLLSLSLALLLPVLARAEWQRHTIDASSRGADGVRLTDVNRDGHPDIATGWEEGGQIRAYLHPGTAKVRAPWPRVTVGAEKSPEDAVFVDLDGDGILDVISSCEGKTRTLFAHWAPRDNNRYLQSTRWNTEAIPCSQDLESWMFTLPLASPPTLSRPILVGSKGENASVSRLQISPDPKRLDQWTLKTLYKAGWIMSLRPLDLNADAYPDVLVSDRKGPKSGVLWLENPGKNHDAPWKEHRIGADGEEVMFLDFITSQGNVTVAVYAKPNQLFLFSASLGEGRIPRWTTVRHTIDANIGTAKAVCFTDVDLDGTLDLVASCEHATGERTGVFWFPMPEPNQGPIQKIHDIAGPEGIKFDRLETLDLDGDGDLDVLTCEENENLGVIWYENPHK